MKKEKHENYKTCPVCKRGGFTVSVGFKRPVYTCTQCDARWEQGCSGGDYFKHALNYTGQKPRDFVGFYWEGDDFLKNPDVDYQE